MTEPATDTNAAMRQLLCRITYGVKSYARSKRFYDPVMATLSSICLYDYPHMRLLGYGLAGSSADVVYLFEEDQRTAQPRSGVRFSFNAPHRRSVREFWEAALQNGGSNVERPAMRPDYGVNYYAAYVKDPDGYSLEAVFVGEDELETSGMETNGMETNGMETNGMETEEMETEEMETEEMETEEMETEEMETEEMETEERETEDDETVNDETKAS